MNRKDLLQKLNQAKPFLMGQDFIPILMHYCFDTKHVIAYNDVSGIQISMESDLHCAVPGSLMLKMLNTMTSETVRIDKLNDRNIQLLDGKTKVKLPILPTEEFIFKLPDISSITPVILAKSFLKGLEKCATSVGNDPAHPDQQGIFWSVGPGFVKIYSTDNKTLSKFFQEAPGIGHKEHFEVITPAFFCEQLTALSDTYADGLDYIELYFGKDFVVASLGENSSCIIFTRLIPTDTALKYEEVITGLLENVTKDHYVTPPDGFIPSLERASVILNAKVDGGSASIVVEEKDVTITAESVIGKSVDTLEFPLNLGQFSFRIDPNLVLRGFKVASKIALLDTLLVLTSDSYVHLISHSEE